MRESSLMRLEQKVSHDVDGMVRLSLCGGFSKLALCSSDCVGSLECTVPHRSSSSWLSVYRIRTNRYPFSIL
jgi:hypothetical protein